MNAIPVRPRRRQISEAERKSALAWLRRFHLGDPLATQAATALPPGVLPAALYPFRDARSVRSDFPVHIGDGTPGAPFATPVADWLAARIDAASKSSAGVRLVADNIVRVERLVRDLVREAGGRRGARDALDAAGERLSAELKLVGDPAQQLRAQWAGVIAGTQLDGQLLGLDRHTPLILLLAAARVVVPPRRAAFAAEVVRLRDALRNTLAVEQQKDQRGDGPAAMRDSVGAVGARLLDPQALSRVIGPHRGSVRLDPRRRARIEMALAVLEDHAEVSDAPLLTVVHAPGTGSDLADPTIRKVSQVDPTAAALALFDVEAERCALAFRAVRTAQLELDGAYDPERHDPWLETLDWRSFTVSELLLVPTVVVDTTARELCGAGLPDLSMLLASGRPVHVLARVLPADNPAAAGSGDFVPYRLELGYLGIGHREAFVQQATAARPAHLGEGFMTALGRPRAALHVVDTGLGLDGCEPQLGAWLHAGAAIEGRAHPLFRFDPAAGATWARRMDIAGNPAPQDDWAGADLRFVDPEGAEIEVSTMFTFVDFALLETSCAREFAPIDEAIPDEDLMSIADALAAPSDHALSGIPFVFGVDADGVVRRFAVSRRLCGICRDRADFWRTLQELAGVRNEHVREAVARAEELATVAARAERDALLAAHRTELEREREQAVQNAMQGLARSLLDLGPASLDLGGRSAGGTGTSSSHPVAPAAAMPTAAASTEAAFTEAASTEAAFTEVLPANEVAAASVEFEEAWIDTPLCTSCNDCRNVNPVLFVYDANKQARIGDPKAGTFRQLVTAAEKCPARCIHPGLPLDPAEPELDALIARAAPFNR